MSFLDFFDHPVCQLKHRSSAQWQSQPLVHVSRIIMISKKNWASKYNRFTNNQLYHSRFARLYVCFFLFFFLFSRGKSFSSAIFVYTDIQHLSVFIFPFLLDVFFSSSNSLRFTFSWQKLYSIPIKMRMHFPINFFFQVQFCWPFFMPVFLFFINTIRIRMRIRLCLFHIVRSFIV